MMADFLLRGIDADDGQQKSITDTDVLVDTAGNTFTGLIREIATITAGSGSPYTISSSDFHRLLINTGVGAGGSFADLPSAAAALGPISIYVDDSNGWTLNAASGDTIRAGSSVSTSGGTMSSTTIGSCLILIAVDSTQWVAASEIGSWSTA